MCLRELYFPSLVGANFVIFLYVRLVSKLPPPPLKIFIAQPLSFSLNLKFDINGPGFEFKGCKVLQGMKEIYTKSELLKVS